jgi:uncharacterized membrane protein YGL010W
MKRVDALLSDYGSHHTTRGNLVCHSIGIPLIVFGTFSFLREVPLSPASASWTAAEVFVAIAIAFYAFLDLPLALAMVLPIAILYGAARAVGSWKVGLAAFLIGWVFQGIGHGRYEKNSPAFFRNLLHLLVGPLFLVNELVHRRRISSPASLSPGAAEK